MRATTTPRFGYRSATLRALMLLFATTTAPRAYTAPSRPAELGDHIAHIAHVVQVPPYIGPCCACCHERILAAVENYEICLVRGWAGSRGRRRVRTILGGLPRGAVVFELRGQLHAARIGIGL